MAFEKSINWVFANYVIVMCRDGNINKTTHQKRQQDLWFTFNYAINVKLKIKCFWWYNVERCLACLIKLEFSQRNWNVALPNTPFNFQIDVSGNNVPLDYRVGRYRNNDKQPNDVKDVHKQQIGVRIGEYINGFEPIIFITVAHLILLS